ncbi:hypothetical protein WN51_03371 [Melipona quadrifasciata]|uniref:Uncharacterized protein n=1 Tax=Melipona quadrifasciata TaxID=166423 RepID=A0A0N0BDU1_9HYME|nr:hypothetical protein WN51_03371 [Melipona quadrifasciata]
MRRKTNGGLMRANAKRGETRREATRRETEVEIDGRMRRKTEVIAGDARAT